LDEAVGALEKAGHPVVRIRLHDAYDLGAQFFLWEMATTVASQRLAINPFDQPNVEAAKVLARKMVAEYAESRALPEGDFAPLSAAALDEFLEQAQPGEPSTGSGQGPLTPSDFASHRSYVSIQAYVQPTSQTSAALQKLRIQLRDRHKLATTVGYGPRFLHSTGQLHKGDGGNGLFVQFTAEDARDAPIPDKAGGSESSISFGVLKTAQALGDGQALTDAGRRVIRFHLGSDVLGGLQRIIEQLEKQV
jgi:hypothetical protein